MKAASNFTEMIVQSWKNVATEDWNSWKWQFANRIRTLPALAATLNQRSLANSNCSEVIHRYPVAVTPYYASLMVASDSHCPIRIQAVPDPREIHYSLGGTADPLAEEQHMEVPGLVHRYPDRCLVIVTNVCATYCRHCNRKRIWKQKPAGDMKTYHRRIIDAIAAKPSIREVILSGGDPLTMSDRAIESFLSALRSIPHVEVVRIGSRTPVVMPMRITKPLCAILRKYRPLWFNTQFNHPREITPESTKACEMILETGIPVSSQTVLLRHINDCYDVMRDLLYGLQRIAVRPYYLFQCDPVMGTDHFRTDIWAGMEIMEKLWSNVSGLCLPKYVLDVPGGKGKIPLQPFSLLNRENTDPS